MSGLGRLASGLGRLASGLGRLASGLGRLASGLGRLASGLDGIARGLDMLASGRELIKEPGRERPKKPSHEPLRSIRDIGTMVYKHLKMSTPGALTAAP